MQLHRHRHRHRYRHRHRHRHLVLVAKRSWRMRGKEERGGSMRQPPLCVHASVTVVGAIDRSALGLRVEGLRFRV